MTLRFLSLLTDIRATERLSRLARDHETTQTQFDFDATMPLLSGLNLELLEVALAISFSLSECWAHDDGSFSRHEPAKDVQLVVYTYFKLIATYHKAYP